MSLVSTKTPIFDDIPSIEFFNGRLLSGEDMTTEQAWNAARRKLLGQALGSGVAFGLEVSVSAKTEHAGKPIVTVEPGLALNADGATLSLTERTDVSLVRIEEIETVPAEFTACQPTQYSAYVKSDGVFLLTLCPAQGTQGRAPVSGLANQEARCNRKYRREGVQFRLHQIKLTEAELADRNKLRNLVAYKCFNPEAWQAFVTEPFGAPDTKPKLLDGLLVPKLEDSEVPLATIFWTTDGGIEYVDLWSVRRWRVTVATAFESLPSYSRLLIAGEARYHQFSNQIHEIAARRPLHPTQANRDMSDFFQWVPPAGFVPVSSAAASQGLDPNVFFGGRPLGDPTIIERADALIVLERSLRHGAVEASADVPLQLYWIRENLSAVHSGAANQLYLLYAYRGLHGFLEKDLVARTFGQTWRSYSDLLRKGVVLPATVATDALPTWVALHTLQQNIIQFALAREGLAAGRLLNQPDTEQVMSELYQLQKGLVSGLRLTFPGDTRTASRSDLASRLELLLDTTPPGGIPGLKPALDAHHLKKIMNAQKAINALVSSYAGEIPFGHLQVSNTGRPDGDVLVVNNSSRRVFRYVFEVTNRTDRRTDIVLDASITNAPTGSWGGTIVLRRAGDTSGTQVSRITLNPDEMVVLEAVITVPPNAVSGEDVLLRVAAALPPPADRDYEDIVELRTGTTGGPAVEWLLEHTVVRPATGRSNAATSTTYPFLIDTAFLASRAPTSATATITVTPAFTGGSAGWIINVIGTVPVTIPASGPISYTVSLPVSGNQGKEQTSVEITTPASRPPAANGNSVCRFTISATTTIVDPLSGATVTVNSMPTEELSVTLRP